MEADRQEVYLVWAMLDDGVKTVLAAYADRATADRHRKRAVIRDVNDQGDLLMSAAELLGVTHV